MNDTRRCKGILRTQIRTTLIACKDHGRKKQQHLQFLWMTLKSSMRWTWKICFSLQLMPVSYEVKQHAHIHSANTEPCQHLQAWTRGGCMYNQQVCEAAVHVSLWRTKLCLAQRSVEADSEKVHICISFPTVTVCPPDNSQSYLCTDKGCFSFALTAVLDAR